MRKCMSCHKSIVLIKGKTHCFHYDAHHASSRFQYFVCHRSAITSNTSSVRKGNFTTSTFYTFSGTLKQLQKLKARKSKLKEQKRRAHWRNKIQPNKWEKESLLNCCENGFCAGKVTVYLFIRINILRFLWLLYFELDFTTSLPCSSSAIPHNNSA